MPVDAIATQAQALTMSILRNRIRAEELAPERIRAIQGKAGIAEIHKIIHAQVFSGT